MSPATYAALSAAAYGTYPIPAGWTKIASNKSDSDGFRAVAYENAATSQVVIAYKGTVVGTSAYDAGSLGADAKIGAGIDPKAFTDAANFANAVINSDVPSGYSVSVTGHSLGGAEAEWVASQTGLGGATFGAPGVANAGPAATTLTDYQDYGDPVPGFGGPHVGSIAQVGDPDNSPTSANNPINSPYGPPLGIYMNPSQAQSYSALNYLVQGLTQYHGIVNYGVDLGANITPLQGTEAAESNAPSLEDILQDGVVPFGSAGAADLNQAQVVNGDTLETPWFTISNGSSPLNYIIDQTENITENGKAVNNDVGTTTITLNSTTELLQSLTFQGVNGDSLSASFDSFGNPSLIDANLEDGTSLQSSFDPQSGVYENTVD